MHYVENTFISSFNLQQAAYFRYIDEIFLIRSHGIYTLETFLEDTNRNHPNISFTHEYSTTAVSILDVIININNGIISTSSYKKNIDNHGYHHYTSCHPMHMKNSIIFFTASQIQRNMFRQKGFYQAQQRTSRTFFAHRPPN